MSSPADPRPDARSGNDRRELPATPPPLSPPPRSALGIREMLVALLVLVPVILLIGGVTRGCSFSPGGPSIDPAAVPRVDAAAELRGIAETTPFALRIPVVPAGWRANSTDQARVADGRAVRAGWVTDTGTYLRLVQSDAPEPALLAVETGGLPVARGTTDVAGQRWVAYVEESGEQVWVAEVMPGPGPPVRWLLTGSASEEQFRALAGGTSSGEQLPPGVAP